MQIEGLRVKDWVGGDVVDHGVIVLLADAGHGDLVEFAHALQTSSEILNFGLGDFTKLGLADVLAGFEAVAGCPSVEPRPTDVSGIDFGHDGVNEKQ